MTDIISAVALPDQTVDAGAKASRAVEVSIPKPGVDLTITSYISFDGVNFKPYRVDTFDGSPQLVEPKGASIDTCLLTFGLPPGVQQVKVSAQATGDTGGKTLSASAK